MTAIYLVYPRKFSRLMRPRKAAAWERVAAPWMMLLLTRLFDRGITGLAAAWLVVAAAAVLLSGCSFDGAFPAVHDMPAARTETLLTPDEVKQSTDNLASDRDRLAAMAATVER
jgi:hypothetical protein